MSIDGTTSAVELYDVESYLSTFPVRLLRQICAQTVINIPPDCGYMCLYYNLSA